MTTIILPSRGLIFADTVAALWREVKNIGAEDVEIVFVSGLPIPDAQNKAVKEALMTSAKLLLWVEEDMILPEGVFRKMLEAQKMENADIVVVDYPVGQNYSTICKKDGEILWFGLGCTLIKREVFEKLGQDNWFETDKSVKINNLATLDYEIVNIPAKYGGHDILFGLKVKEKGFKVVQITDVEAGQYRLIELGRPEYNNGMHKISKLEGIKHLQQY